MPYKDVAPPAGEKITRTDRLNVPDQPIIPFIRGDGTGPDIWAASVRVFDAAVEKAYGGKKKIAQQADGAASAVHHGAEKGLVVKRRVRTQGGRSSPPRAPSTWLVTQPSTA